MQVRRIEDVEGQAGTTFTGPVTLARVLAAQQEGGLALSVVRFEDGARTNWHTHPGEQILIVIEGEGRAGTETEEFSLSPGSIVYAPPGERHWHGAQPGQTMTHFSITSGGAPDWFGPPE